MLASIVRFSGLLLLSGLIVVRITTDYTCSANEFFFNGIEIGYLIILIGLLIGPVHRKVERFYILVGSVLFYLSGGILMNEALNYDEESQGMEMIRGYLSLFQGSLLLFDAFIMSQEDINKS